MSTRIRSVYGLAVAAAVLLAANIAHAGIVDGTLATTIVNGGGTYAWQNVGADGNGLVSLTAPIASVASYDITGTLDGIDPNLTIIQNITNTTGSDWDTYTIDITPAAGYTVSNIQVNLPLTPHPNYLPNVLGWGALPTAVLSGNQIIYTGGLVPAGATFQTYFTFDITESSGSFGYSVANSPHLVPEPASLSLVGLGAMLLLRRKR